MVWVVLLERYNNVKIKNRMYPFLIIVSKGCIINTMSFHNCTKKRNKLGTRLWQGKTFTSNDEATSTHYDNARPCKNCYYEPTGKKKTLFWTFIDIPFTPLLCNIFSMM